MVKKVFTLAILVLVASLLVMPVFAASAHMSVSVSKDTVTRGETITVTVSTSAVENCLSGGFSFGYNTEVFEYVGGSALVGGFAAAGVTGGEGYFANTSGGTTVQGTLFQITLRVRDNAPYGSYIISGAPYMTVLNGEDTESVSCSAGGATVTVVCNHSYGEWTKLDEDQHGKTCANCGGVEKEDHAWVSDRVIQEATCKEGGWLQQICSVCSATRIVNTEPHDNHIYGGWTNANDQQHQRICSVCQKEDFAGHSWDAGTVSKEPNCKEGGKLRQTCRTCGAIHITDTKPTTEHKYDNACDTDCNVCGLTREIEHTFEEAWETDENNHWHVCTGCGLKQDEEAHIPGDEAAGTETQVCIICGYALAPTSGAEETTAPTESVEATAPTTPEEPNDSTVTIILWGIIAAIVTATVGVIVVMPKKKKK